MIASKLAARAVGPDRPAVRRRKRQVLTKRRGCREVARRRAARYASKRCIPKALWPLIAAAILIWVIFDPRPPRAFAWAGKIPDTDGNAIRSAAMPDPDEGQDIDRSVDSGDTRSANDGIPQPKHLPPSGFLAEDVAQVIAFLLRNRGRLDNDAVRAKWDIVDRISLPLAIYLREVEARAAWDDLEQEVSAAPWGTPPMSGRHLPKSPRHRKLLRLLPEWSRRGDHLMSKLVPDDTTSPPAPERDRGDDRDREPPKP